MHYIGVFETFPGDNDLGYERVVLEIYPLDDETSQNLREHFELTIFVLSVFERTMANVVAVVGENTTTNRTFSQIVGRTFVGCHNHRFNMKVNDLISGNQKIMDKMQSIIRKLSYCIPSAMLRRLATISARKLPLPVGAQRIKYCFSTVL